jgi:hypothetical protein
LWHFVTEYKKGPRSKRKSMTCMVWSVSCSKRLWGDDREIPVALQTLFGTWSKCVTSPLSCLLLHKFTNIPNKFFGLTVYGSHHHPTFFVPLT